MKIGLSLSYCVLDIFLGKVQYHEILLITTGTRFDPPNDADWRNIWRGYSQPYAVWGQYPDKEMEFKSIVLDLHCAGKLHQPRKFNGHPYRDSRDRSWYDVMPEIDEIESNPTLSASWRQFKTLAALTDTKIGD